MKNKKTAYIYNKRNKFLVYKKFISIVMILTLVTGFYCDNTSMNVSTKAGTNKTVKIVKELKKERTKNTNTYLLSNGTKKKEIFFEDIRYEKNGKLINYDSRLSQISEKDVKSLNKRIDKRIEDYLLVNKKGDSKQYFPAELSKKTGIVLNNGEYTFEMAPLVDEVYNIESNNNTIEYKTPDNKEVYQYISQNHSVKENIILNEKPNNYKFEFLMDFGGAKIKRNETDNSLIVVDSKKEKQIAYVEPAFLFDSKGIIDQDHIKYEIKSAEEYIKEEKIKNIDKEDYKNKTIIVISIDEEFFDNKSLKYPITIDPTITWTNGYLKSASVWSAVPNTRYSGNPITVANDMADFYPYLGSTRIGYLDTSYITSELSASINGIITDTKIENASLNFYELDKPTFYSPAGKVDITPITSSWDYLNVSWNVRPNLANQSINDTTCTGILGTEHNVDITNWMQDIVDGNIENKGLAFTCPNTKTTAYFYGPAGRSEYDSQGLPQNPYRLSISIVYNEGDVYNPEIKLETRYQNSNNKIEIRVNDASLLPEGVSVDGYKVSTRKNNNRQFKTVAINNEIEDVYELSVDDITNNIDIRACVCYSDGSVKSSNIVTYSKNEYSTETTTGEESGPVNNIFTQTHIDTDGDGLEDGYEIWDFKTLWNTESSNSTSENPEYIQDSDEDGIPDGTEVLYLGTNPADTDDFTLDSDEDNLSDYEEYLDHTDPYLNDSDFDGLDDGLDDYPRRTDTQTNTNIAAGASINNGLYDATVIEMDEDITYTNIINKYSNRKKQSTVNCGTPFYNKRYKYFYDEYGNTTSIVEQRNEISEGIFDKTLCVTYTYDSNNNIENICDIGMKYSMNYDNNNKMTSIKVGNQTIESINNNIIMNNEDDESASIGDLIKIEEDISNFGNGQSIKKKTYKYKLAEGDYDTKAYAIEVYLNNEVTASYKLEYNSEGSLIKTIDYTQNSNNPIIYNYDYSNGNTYLTRNDGFEKTIIRQSNYDNQNSINEGSVETNYNYKDITDNNNSRNSIAESEDDNSVRSSVIELPEKGKYERTYDKDERIDIEQIYKGTSSIAPVLGTTKTINSKNLITKSISSTYNYLTTTKTYSYSLDSIGNLYRIKKNNTIIQDYSYDEYSRIEEENNYELNKCKQYQYDIYGNIIKITTYNLNNNGNKIISSKEEKNVSTSNTTWKGQISNYDGQAISYDASGNPTSYLDGTTLEWTQGRLLKKAIFNSNVEVEYKHDENGNITVRDYKVGNSHYKTYLEWEGNKVLREKTVINNNPNKDVWYIYDEKNDIVGYDYKTKDANNNIITQRVYYEKDINGSVIGLINENGLEIATYTYDSWGNIINSSILSGYSSVVNSNHIKFKGYYFDDITYLYYMDNGLYSSRLYRMINPQEPTKIVDQLKSQRTPQLGYNNYMYSFSNPISLPIDDTGYNVEYSVNDEVEVCNTNNLWFESMEKFNTNCYGFVVNRWRKKGISASILPGWTLGYELDYYYQFRSCSEIADNVKQDSQNTFGPAEILTGNNNNPFFETDNDHLLIALRTMTRSDYYNTRINDSFHFMVRKADGWYFKDGSGKIFKLKENQTPDTVSWNKYDIDSSGYYRDYILNFYNSNTQYIVIPKMDLTIG